MDCIKSQINVYSESFDGDPVILGLNRICHVMMDGLITSQQKSIISISNRDTD